MVGVTRDTGIVKPTYYSASCGGSTTVAGWGYWLSAVNCPCGAYGHGVNGHRHGMCQWGSSILATLGWDWLQILDHYFNMDWDREYGVLGPLPHPTIQIPNSPPWTPGPAPVPPTPVPPTPPAPVTGYDTDVDTWIEWIKNCFGYLKLYAGNAADAARPIPLVGGTLSTALNYLSSYLENIWMDLITLQPKIGAHHRFIQDILTTDLIRRLLNNIWPELGTSIFQGIDWVLDQIKDRFPAFPGLLADPGGYIHAAFTEFWPTMDALIYYPRIWFDNLIAQYFPALRPFLTNPVGEVIRLVRLEMEITYGVIYGPVATLKGLLMTLLHASEGLFTDTWGYITWQVYGNLVERAAAYKNLLWSFGEDLLKRMLDEEH